MKEFDIPTRMLTW